MPSVATATPIAPALQLTRWRIVPLVQSPRRCYDSSVPGFDHPLVGRRFSEDLRQSVKTLIHAPSLIMMPVIVSRSGRAREVFFCSSGQNFLRSVSAFRAWAHSPELPSLGWTGFSEHFLTPTIENDSSRRKQLWWSLDLPAAWTLERDLARQLIDDLASRRRARY